MRRKLSVSDFKLKWRPPDNLNEYARVELEMDGVVIAAMWEDGQMRVWDGDFYQMMNGGR